MTICGGRASTVGGTRSNLYRVVVKGSQEGEGANLTPSVRLPGSVASAREREVELSRGGEVTVDARYVS